MAAVHLSERLSYAGGTTFWEEVLQDPALAEEDTLVGFDAAGTMIAFAGALVHRADAGSRVVTMFEAHPDHIEIDSALLSWASARGAARLAGASGERVIRAAVEEHRHRKRRIVEEAGLHHARSFAEMRRTINRPLGVPPPLPPGLTIEPWTEHRSESARVASNEAFTGHWGSLPMSEADWRARYIETAAFRPELSNLAVAADRVVSLCLAEVDDESAETADEVWIDRVATAPAFRSQSLATALILRTLSRAAESGLTTAGLEVDEDSANNATALYERIGFAVEDRSVHYIKEL